MGYTDSIAVISLTHNHPKTVEDVILNSAKYYKESGIEIYFYDSSPNDKTKQIIDRYISIGYDNLIHVSLPNMDMVDKMKMLFAGEGLKKQYKYIWPTKDRAYVKPWVLNQVLEAVNNEYDIIFTTSAAQKGVTEYTNAVDFYHDMGGWVTSINLTIYNTRTILLNHKISEKPYYCDGSEAFLQLSATFYGLSLLEKPRIRIIDVKPDGISMSRFSDTMTPHSIEAWKDNWIKANDFLPSIYNDYKDEIIKKTASLPWILGDIDILIELKEEGKISKDNLEWVLDGWERISDIPKEKIVAIVNDEYDPNHDLSFIKADDEMINLLIKLVELLNKGKDITVPIPEEAIFGYLVKLISSTPYLDKSRKKVILGSIKDILDRIGNIDSNEEKSKGIQEILSYMLLI